MKTSLIIFALMVGLLSTCSRAQSPLDQILRQAGVPDKPSGLTLSNDKITAGLKEGLKVSTANAVKETGRRDGFLGNEAIKILLPEKLRTVGKGMRLMGMGAQLDDLEVGMNRAAEQAAPEAKQIFIRALTRMSFQDARNILSGGDTAATEYFKKTSTDPLTIAFRPIVHRSMEKVGVIQQYNQIVQKPMVSAVVGRQGFDLDNYVVGKTLDGLFYMLAQEEKRIRKDPAAQITPLLREVFGKRF